MPTCELECIAEKKVSMKFLHIKVSGSSGNRVSGLNIND